MNQKYCNTSNIDPVGEALSININTKITPPRHCLLIWTCDQSRFLLVQHKTDCCALLHYCWQTAWIATTESVQLMMVCLWGKEARCNTCWALQHTEYIWIRRHNSLVRCSSSFNQQVADRPKSAEGVCDYKQSADLSILCRLKMKYTNMEDG